ncbi:MAG: hypothetical protein FJ100_16740 [Deltaproteobacteria bacterium]|nr:hypothetical protein [Deltaproteobacteria bacterium]
MSEARPITDVTDFVCGACWNSFSKADPGVDRGTHVACPHCGHAMPVETSITDSVRTAPRVTAPDPGSGGFEPPGPETLPGNTFVGDDGFPELRRPSGAAWLPADMVARSAEPAGFVVGDAGDLEDFDFDEPTLRPDVARPGLLEAVRTMGEVDPTPVDFAFDEAALREPPAYAGTLVPKDETAAPTAEAAVLSDTPELDAAPAQAADAAASPIEQDAEAAFVGGDWKLKAMGLTYNFHGLDALIGRASSKTGQQMQVSIDGVTWKDFDSFHLLYKSGVPASKALADAPEPGATGLTPQALPQIPAAANGSGRNRPTLTRANAPDLSISARSDEKAKAPGPKDKSDAIGANGRPSSPVVAKAGVGPASGPSKRQPAVAAADTGRSGGKGLVIAIAVAVVVVAAVGALHILKVIAIPGL